MDSFGESSFRIPRFSGYGLVLIHSKFIFIKHESISLFNIQVFHNAAYTFCQIQISFLAKYNFTKIFFFYKYITLKLEWLISKIIQWLLLTMERKGRALCLFFLDKAQDISSVELPKSRVVISSQWSAECWFHGGGRVSNWTRRSGRSSYSATACAPRWLGRILSTASTHPLTSLKLLYWYRSSGKRYQINFV